ncbi:FAD-dependent oxidoreductase [Saccharothrix sp. 6-C]|uniref:NAD(P)/FAD-dependent oxidoreductase n=1 Tax=Saccharothrix sp. 6-C TaxID=2781735 RepID=UPI001916F21E|nr:FAD-dependent oxidoreductase [Saccharothrix sp. 6-C]QQQ79541.1 FAD-dependent oxidoreductase [Saccharothrix sp. 6-C]
MAGAADVVVAGGSAAGLLTAFALATSGARVLVLERSADPGGRAGVGEPFVPQAGHAHTVTSAGVTLLRQHAPVVLDALSAAGAHVLTAHADDGLPALACRRTTFDRVLRGIVREVPGVEVRHGTAVRGLTLDPTRRRVTGVVSDDGPAAAGAVVDATGTRARSVAWLSAAGAPTPTDWTRPSDLLGFTRFYRGPSGPLNRGHGAGGVWDHFAGVVHPGDGDSFSVSLGVLPTDPVLGALRHEPAFTAAARATPWVRDWLSGPITPISPVRAMSSPPNVLRSPVPVHGLHLVGDAACTTNALLGRGISMAIAHAFRLAASLPDDTAHEFSEPWYRHAVRWDRERVARWTAVLNGRSVPLSPLWRVDSAARTDPKVRRVLARVLMGTDSPESLDEEWLVARARDAPPAPYDGPTRGDLVRAVHRVEEVRT